MAPQARARPRAAPTAGRAPTERVSIADVTLDEIESVAQIGSYAADLLTGRWASSAGLDAIFGIDAAFERSVESWASLIHPRDRAAMVDYLTGDVAARGRPFDRQYRILRADSGEERWVHGRGRLEVDGSGRPVRMLGTIADITEQHRAQEALRASEARYAAILEGTAEAILIADSATHRYRWVNAAACALLGYTREELLAMRVHDLHPAVALPTILAKFGEVVDGQISEGRAVPCLRKDGSMLFADIRSSTATVEGVPCNIAFFTDVTELRELDQALRRSERNLAEAQRIAAIGSWEWDLATGTALRSEELHRIYGVDPGELAATSEAVFPLVHPDDRARVEAFVRAAIAGGGRHDLEYRVVRPDGRVRIIHEQAEVHRDAQGVGIRMFGTTQDVTDQVTAEAERSRLAMAVEQTSDAVLITDLAGTIEYANPAFEAISGYRRSEVIGQNPRILKSGRQSAAFYRAMWDHLAGGRNWTGRFINRRAAGSLCQV